MWRPPTQPAEPSYTRHEATPGVPEKHGRTRTDIGWLYPTWTVLLWEIKDYCGELANLSERSTSTIARTTGKFPCFSWLDSAEFTHTITCFSLLLMLIHIVWLQKLSFVFFFNYFLFKKRMSSCLFSAVYRKINFFTAIVTNYCRRYWVT